MKKIIKLLLLLVLPLICLSSCKKKEDKVLISSTYNTKSAINLDEDAWSDKVANADSFILYVYSNGCTSCTYFESNVLNKYIKEKSIDIYKIEDCDYKIDTLPRYQTNPKLVIFKQGAIINQISIKQNENIFNNKNDLSKYLDKYIVISNMQVVKNWVDLDTLKTNNVIYFGWIKCGDCQYLDTYYLKKYLIGDYDTFYYFETNEWRVYKDTESNKVWTDFINKYDLNINSNNGVVPTIIKYNNGVREDFVTFFNDTLFEFNDTYIVTNTQYGNNESIVGNSYTSYFDYQKGTAEYHFNKVDTFMNKYL